MRRPILALAILGVLPWSDAPAAGGPADAVRIDPSCYPGAPPPVGALGDLDADGFADAQDTCPSQPETANGHLDLDGCPDEVPPPPPPEEIAESAEDVEGVVYGPRAATPSSAELTRDFLQRVPSGRSYQSATGMSAGVSGSGGNPNIAGAAPAAEPPAPDLPPRPGQPPQAADDDAPSRVGEILEWGASVFLSNDDSMSLASAQRVIFALKHGLPLPVDHIRPHELLNYFSFDAPEPSAEQLFDVSASAVRHGDTLSVALAVKGASPKPLPLDLTLVVDRSGSMAQEGRMDYTRRALDQLAGHLAAGDRVDLVAFDHEVCVPLQGYRVGRDDPRLLTWAVSNLAPRGMTDLDAGLKKAYEVQLARTDTHRRNRRVMVLTDAQLNTGDVNPHTVAQIGQAFDEQGIRLTGVGVGSTFRDDVLDKLTEKGKGAYVFLGSEAVVDRVFGIGFPSLVSTIAHDVQFRLDLPESLAMKRFYGEESSTDAADVQPIHYYAGTSQLFLQDLSVKGERLRPKDPLRLVIEYRDARTGEPATRTFATTVGELVEADPHNVRKAQALMAWTDLLQVRAMSGDACGEPLRTYAARAAHLPDDAEIGFVNGLVRGVCGEFDLPVAVAAAPLKVRVDSDQPITRVGVRCGDHEAGEALTAADRVASLDAVPGTCIVTLAGLVDMQVEVEVPEMGRDLRCTVRAGRVHCSG